MELAIGIGFWDNRMVYFLLLNTMQFAAQKYFRYHAYSI